MTQTVKMPDGTIHNFPDEATPQMISSALGVQPQGVDDRTAAQYKSDNQKSGFWDNFGKSAQLGMAKRVLGAEELGLNLANPVAKALGGNLDDMKAAVAGGQQEAEMAGTGTGVAGALGEVVGDPVTWATGAVGKGAQGVKGLMAAGAAGGAASGATQGTGNANSNLSDEAKNALIGAGVGGATGAIIPGAVKIAAIPVNAVKAGGNRIAAALGSDAAADRIVYGQLAAKLQAAGKSPAEIEAAITAAKASGLSPTLGEATGTRSVLQGENTLARGSGEASQNFNDAIAERGAQDIPATIENKAQDLLQGRKEAKTLYPAAANEANTMQGTAEAAIADPNGVGANVTLDSIKGLNKPWQALQSARDSIATRLGQIGKVNNVESKSLAAAKDILDNAEQRGMSFDAILDAKKQLDNLYIEGADASAQKQANRYVTEFTKDLDASLSEVAPTNYPLAKAASKKGMAGQDLLNSVNESGVGDVNAMYNSMWKTPEQRADFLNKLPDDASRAEYKQFFDMLERVRNGHGGMPAGIAGGAAEGSTIPLTKPGLVRSAIDKVGEMLTPSNIQTRGTEAALNPDAARLAAGVEKAGSSVAENPAVQAAVAGAATEKGRMPQVAPAQAPAAAAPQSPVTDPTAPFGKPTAPQQVNMPADGKQAQIDIIQKGAEHFGNNPDTMRQMAMIESSLNPDAANENSTASGLYQFTDGTWKDMVNKYGVQYGVGMADKKDPRAQVIMANLLAKENAAGLKNTIGREPNGTELYIAHVLGLSGAKKLLTNLDKPVAAAQIFPTAAQANIPLFFIKGDTKQPLTPAGIYRTLEQRMQGAA